MEAKLKAGFCPPNTLEAIHHWLTPSSIKSWTSTTCQARQGAHLCPHWRFLQRWAPPGKHEDSHSAHWNDTPMLSLPLGASPGSSESEAGWVVGDTEVCHDIWSFRTFDPRIFRSVAWRVLTVSGWKVKWNTSARQPFPRKSESDTTPLAQAARKMLSKCWVNRCRLSSLSPQSFHPF